MPWAGNIAKTMTSNRKQFTVTREMLTAVAGISARYSKFAFVLFCYIPNHLMTGPLGNSEFCFPRISIFPSTSSRETLRLLGNKIHCSPRGPVIKCSMLTLRNLLNNWRKNNHNTVDKNILPSQSVCIFFTNFSFQIYFSAAENRRKKQNPLAIC